MNFLIAIFFNSLVVSLILNDANTVDDNSYANYKLEDFDQAKKTLCQFKIEDKLVSETEYEQFCDSLSLVEIEGTYVCKKMSGGGHNWYDAKDKNSVIYTCGSKVDHQKCYEYIYQKK